MSVKGESERLEPVSDLDDKIPSVSDPWVLIAECMFDERRNSAVKRLALACNPAAGSKIKFHMTNGQEGCEGRVS